MIIRTYSELIRIPTFKERFEYLSIGARLGDRTFGSKRFLNQDFYHSSTWRDLRDYLIVRDRACDLAHPDWPIMGKVIIHHINPITDADFSEMNNSLLDPENLVCVSHKTHNAIHYGDVNQLSKAYIDRKPNDTCPWK